MAAPLVVAAAPAAVSLFESAFVSALVGQAVNRLIDAACSHAGSKERSLECFLSIFSHDLNHRMETIFRLTFVDQNLHSIKSKTLSAQTALRTWLCSQRRDQTQLDIALSKVLGARSLLMNQIDRLTEINVDYRPQADSDQTRWKASMFFDGGINCTRLEDGSFQGNQPFLGVKKAVTHMSHLEAASKALGSISTLDISIILERMILYPSLRAEAILRLDEYIEKARQLREAYLTASVFSAAMRYPTAGNSFIAIGFAAVYIESQIVEAFPRTIPGPKWKLGENPEADKQFCMKPENILSPSAPFKTYSDPLAQTDDFVRFRCIRDEQQEKARQKLASEHHIDSLIHTLTEIRNDLCAPQEVTTSETSTV